MLFLRRHAQYVGLAPVWCVSRTLSSQTSQPLPGSSTAQWVCCWPYQPSSSLCDGPHNTPYYQARSSRSLATNTEICRFRTEFDTDPARKLKSIAYSCDPELVASPSVRCVVKGYKFRREAVGMKYPPQAKRTQFVHRRSNIGTAYLDRHSFPVCGE